MKLRTSNIILIIKGNHNYKNKKGKKLQEKEALRKYMSDTCGCSEDTYNDNVLMGILKVVILDYLKTSDHPELLIGDYFNSICDKDIDKWISAIKHIQVLKTNSESDIVLMNGFNEHNCIVWNENFPDQQLFGVI